MIDIQEKKNKILEFLNENGPSLPVQIARAIQMDPVFASAILSELLGTKQVITSNLRIGSSPLYLLPTQKQKLEEKTDNLKQIEKEAQEKLKEKKVLFDEEESPAIRVALRNIKDFAVAEKHEEKTIWKYAFTPQEEINEILNPEQKPLAQNTQAPKHPSTPSESESVPKAWEAKKEEIKEIKQEQKKVENIFEEKPKEKETPNQETKKEKPKSFLEQIESFLKSQDTTINAIEEVDKTKVIATIKTQNKAEMLFAFNKKRITEKELFTCFKQANKKQLNYQIITKDNPTKKMSDTIQAYKSLSKIQKLEN